MGSSMNAPSKSTLRNNQSRLSTRSLQKSSRKSLLLEKKSSSSLKNEQLQASQTIENTYIRNGDLLIMSRYQDPPTHTNQSNLKETRKMSFGEEADLKSPNFRSLAECGAEYGLGQWAAINNSKEISPSDTHNQDITISFSKAKNHPNIFQEDMEVKKSSLKQILEYGDDGLEPKEKHILQGKNGNEYLEKEIDNILSLKSIYSESYKTPGQSTENTPKKNKQQTSRLEGKRSTKKSSCLKEQSSFQKNTVPHKDRSNCAGAQQVSGQSPVEERLTPCFNDYDTNFQKAGETETSGKTGFKLSQKMQQLKDKIASRANLSRGKGEISKYSIQNLSTSFRKLRNSCSLQKSADSRNSTKLQRIRQKLCRTQCEDEHNVPEDSKDASKVPKKNTPIVITKSPDKKTPQKVSLKPEESKNNREKKQAIRAQIKEPNQSNRGFKSSKVVDGERTKRTKDQSKEINLNDTFSKENPQGDLKKPLKQNEEVRFPGKSKSKHKKITFTDMARKEHFSNKVRKSKSNSMQKDYIKYSQVVESAAATPFQEHLFSSTREENRNTVGYDYEFFDNRADGQAILFKNKDKQQKVRNQQIKKLKKLAQQLNDKQSKLIQNRSFARLQDSEIGSSCKYSTRKNRTFHDKPRQQDRQHANVTAISYQEMLANFEEYMLKESVERPQDTRIRGKQGTVKSRSLEHSKSMNSKHKILIF